MANLFANSPAPRVLLVGTDVSLLISRANLLTQEGYNADVVVKAERALWRASIGGYHLVIVSWAFTTEEQLALRARLKQLKPSLPVLLLTADHEADVGFLNAVKLCLKRKLVVDVKAEASLRPNNDVLE